MLMSHDLSQAIIIGYLYQIQRRYIQQILTPTHKMVCLSLVCFDCGLLLSMGLYHVNEDLKTNHYQSVYSHLVLLYTVEQDLNFVKD